MKRLEIYNREKIEYPDQRPLIYVHYNDLANRINEIVDWINKQELKEKSSNNSYSKGAKGHNGNDD